MKKRQPIAVQAIAQHNPIPRIAEDGLEADHQVEDNPALYHPAEPRHRREPKPHDPEEALGQE